MHMEMDVMAQIGIFLQVV